MPYARDLLFADPFGFVVGRSRPSPMMSGVSAIRSATLISSTRNSNLPVGSLGDLLKVAHLAESLAPLPPLDGFPVDVDLSPQLRAG